MKIALVYDWLTTPYGGAEQVLLAWHEIFPQAPLYTSVYDPQQATWAKNFQVKTSWLQHLPWLRSHHRWLTLLLPLAFESFNFDNYDIVISMSSFCAKGIITKPGQLHICYLLTPTRFLYSHEQHYLKKIRYIPGLKQLINLAKKYLLSWDQMAASRPDILIPISQLVGQRIKQYYHRATAPVIYPPVSIHPANSQSTHQAGPYLIVSRLVPYKRIELAIQACLKLQRQLIIVGDGPAKNQLQSIAQYHPLIKFLGSVSAEQLKNLYNDCRAVLIPGEEDFGITGLEALAYAKPVVVYHQSGIAEVIKDGQHGIHFFEPTTTALITAMTKLEATDFKPTTLMSQAQQFSIQHFQQQWQRLISQLKP